MIRTSWERDHGLDELDELADEIAQEATKVLADRPPSGDTPPSKVVADLHTRAAALCEEMAEYHRSQIKVWQ
jgi:hypothetical protein